VQPCWYCFYSVVQKWFFCPAGRPESRVVVSRLEVNLAFEVESSRSVTAPPSELSGAVGFITSR